MDLLAIISDSEDDDFPQINDPSISEYPGEKEVTLLLLTAVGSLFGQKALLLLERTYLSN